MYKLYYQNMGDDGLIYCERTTETIEEMYKFIQDNSIWNSRGTCEKSSFFKPYKLTVIKEQPFTDNFPALIESLLKEQEAKIQIECDKYNKKYAEEQKEKELKMLEELKKKYEGVSEKTL